MQARALLWISLGLNLLLAYMIVSLSEQAEESTAPLIISKAGTNGPRQLRTSVVVRRQHFHWSEIETPDYAKYIENLRGIGCPENTIRDIIVADVGELYAARISREVVLPEQQWWLPEPNMDVFEAAADQIRALEAEKNNLLTSLLGPQWNVRPRTNNNEPIRLDGPVLSAISSEAKANLYQIEANYRRTREQILQGARETNQPADPIALAEMRQKLRRDLTSILTSEQLEEYLLRYSDTSQNLRQQLRGFGADADEYRRIFRARDVFDEQIAALAGNDSATQRRRAELERQRDEAVRAAIGPERFPLYELTQNPLFQQAQQNAEQNGAPPEKVLPIYQVQQAALQEIAALRANIDLSEAERNAAVRLIEEQQQESIRRIVAGLPAEPPMPPQP